MCTDLGASLLVLDWWQHAVAPHLIDNVLAKQHNLLAAIPARVVSAATMALTQKFVVSVAAWPLLTIEANQPAIKQSDEKNSMQAT